MLVPHEAPISKGYLVPKRGSLRSALTDGGAQDTFHRTIITALNALVRQPEYPCIAAIRSILTDDYRVGAYGEFASASTTDCLSRDLSYFISEQKRSGSVYLSFVAAFQHPESLSEIEFEDLLWQQLGFLHRSSDGRVPWDKRVSSDPRSIDFCFSFQGEGFFVVGLHPAASRKARIFPFPLLIFNLYEQFEELKVRNQYAAMITTNRLRDMKFQGSINPMLTRFGENAEAVQYSGRDVGDRWTCPFQL